MSSVQKMAERVISLNLKNRNGQELVIHGTTVDHLAEKLNERMAEKELVWVTDCHKHLIFQITIERYDALENLLRSLRGNESHGIVVAERKQPGQHGVLDLQVSRALLGKVVVDNSWGDHSRSIEVPGDTFDFRYGYRTSLADIHVRVAPDSVWQKVPHLSRLIHMVDCPHCCRANVYTKAEYKQGLLYTC